MKFQKFLRTFLWSNKKSKLKLKPEVDVGDILKLNGCEIFYRKLLKLEEIHESIPTA